MTATIRTEPADFRCDERTITIPRDMFAVLADQLAQYQRYADDMRAIGRGLHLSSPFGPETIACFVNAVLIESRNRKACDCVICGESTLNDSFVSLPSGHVSHVACRSGWVQS